MPESISVPHQLTSHTKFLHKVAIVVEQKVLLLQRATASESRPDCWDLPGGNSEWPTQINEPTANLHQQDVAREIAEEVGVIVGANEFDFKSLNFLESFYNPIAEIYTIICGWQLIDPAKVGLPTSLSTFTITLSAEHQQFAWVSGSDLEKYDFGGAKGEFVKQIASNALRAAS